MSDLDATFDNAFVPAGSLSLQFLDQVYMELLTIPCRLILF